MEGAQERFILDKGRLAFLMPPVCLFLQGALHVPAALCPRPQLPSSREKPPRSAVMGGGSPSSKRCQQLPSPHSSQVHRNAGLEDTRGDRGTKHQQTGSWKAEGGVCPSMHRAWPQEQRRGKFLQMKNQAETRWTYSRGVGNETIRGSSQEPKLPVHVCR